jgi:hypothetical protein
MATKVLGRNYPIQYEVTPAEVDQGVNWLTLNLNISRESLKGLGGI